MFGLFSGSSSKGMDDELMNLKLSAKQFKRESKKSEKEIGKAKEQVRQAINKGRLDNTRTWEAVSTKLEIAVKTQKVTSSLGQVTKTMCKALQAMDLTKIQQTMDKFEKAVEDTDVVASTVTGAMESTTAASTPANDVEDFMRQVAEENGLEIGNAMPAAGRAAGVAAAEAEPAEEDDLARRLAQLKAR